MTIWSKIILLIASWILTISPGNQYFEGVSGQPRSFLPSQAETEIDKTISSLLYRGLFKYDIYGALAPDLADSWEISEDGLVYTITLKENQKWHDGSFITSEDLIYTSFTVPALSGVATDRVNDRTVRFTLPNKFSPFLSLLTVGVMKNNSQETSDPLQPIGSGQFKVISVKNTGPVVKEIVLYNRKESQNIRKLIFRFYSSEEELVTAASLGEVTAFVATESHELESFTEMTFPLQVVYYSLFLNQDTDFLKDETFRQKLRNSLSMEDLVGNLGILVQGPISKSTFTDENIRVDYYDEDIVEEDLQYKMRLTIPDLPEHETLAKLIRHEWKSKFNLDIEIIKIAPEKIVNEVITTRDYDVLLYGQEVGRDPDRYVYWHSTQSEAPNLNITGFKHVRADRALEEGRNVTDFSERKVHYSEFQSVMEEQVPAIFLYHPYVKYYVNESYEGLGEKFTFTLADRFLDFSNWKRIETN